MSESYEEVFKVFFKGQVSISLLLKYGLDGFTKTENEWKWSNPVTLKLKEFVAFIKRTEVDYNFLEKNN